MYQDVPRGYRMRVFQDRNYKKAHKGPTPIPEGVVVKVCPPGPEPDKMMTVGLMVPLERYPRGVLPRDEEGLVSDPLNLKTSVWHG